MSANFAVKVEAATKGVVSRTEAVWPEDFIESTMGGTQLRALPQMKKFENVIPCDK